MQEYLSTLASFGIGFGGGMLAGNFLSYNIAGMQLKNGKPKEEIREELENMSMVEYLVIGEGIRLALEKYEK